MNVNAAFTGRAGSLAHGREMLREFTLSVSRQAEEPIPFGAAASIAEDLRLLQGEIGRLSAASARLAARAHREGGMGASGFKNLADWFSCAGGLTRSEGAHLANLACPAEGLEQTTAAVEAGQVSASKSARITHWVNQCVNKRDRVMYPEVADFGRAAEEVLLPLAQAPSATCADVDRAGKTLYATLHPGEFDKNERDLHEQRGAALFHDKVRGGYHFSLWGPSADYDKLRTGIEAFTAPPTAGDTRRSQQRTYDSAMDLLDFALSHSGELPHRGGQPAQVRLTMTLATLRGEPGAAPAISDNGVIYPVSAARVAAKDARIQVLISEALNGDVLNVGRTQRLCPPKLRSAIAARYTSCAWEEGCDRPIAWCEIDHKVAWWDGGTTDLDNLQPLCRAHNLAKEHRRAAHERSLRTRVPVPRPEPTPAPVPHPEPTPPAAPPRRADSDRPPGPQHHTRPTPLAPPKTPGRPPTEHRPPQRRTTTSAHAASNGEGDGDGDSRSAP